MFEPQHILVVDDDRDVHVALKGILAQRFQVNCVTTVADALAELSKKDFDVVLLDIRLPDGDGLNALCHIKREWPDTEVIMLTSLDDVRQAVRALQGGAFHYFTKNFEPEELLLVLDKVTDKRRNSLEMKSLRAQVGSEKKKEMYLGNGKAMSELRDTIPRIANLPSTVLIQGETGTGKELLARAIHQSGQYKNTPFIPINLASLSKQLVESELFGHEKGAFTGATSKRIGKFALADRGILFLDEIGEIDNDIQLKLLRFLQEGEFEPVGSNKVVKVDVRLVSATNRNLQKAVEQGKFRQDLYYRLSVIPLHIPPLRERLEDIEVLANIFLKRYCQRLGRGAMTITAEAMQCLQTYRWPGNIRELEHLVERLIATTETDAIHVQHLPLDYVLSEAAYVQNALGEKDDASGGLLKTALSGVERKLIEQSIARAQGSKTKAAKYLGVSLSTLRSKLERLGIE